MNKTISANVKPIAKRQNILYYMHSIIGLSLMFGIGTLKPFGSVTEVGMQVLGIFAGLIYLWSFVSCLWPSMIGLVALGISDYAPIKMVLLNSFGDPVTILVLFSMILFGAVEHSGVTAYISRWFLTRKIINGRPVVFSFIFIYSAYVISALTDVLPAILLSWAILYGVLKEIGYKKGDKYATVMVIGSLFGAISGQAAKPFVNSALMIVGAYEKVSGVQLDYLPYMLFGVIMATLGVVVYCLLIKFVFRPDMSKIANISTERFEKVKLPPMNLQQQIMFFTMFAYMAFILLPSFLPQSIAFVALLNKIGAAGVAVVLVGLLCAVKIDDQPVMNFKEIVGRYAVWDVYFLVAMAMVISGALTADSTGIKELLIQSLNPLLGGQSAAGFSSTLILFSMFITNFANNAVMGVLLMPVVITFGTENGANIPAVVTTLVFALHTAILTPAASPFAAILYGNKEWLEGKDIVKYGFFIVISMFLLYTLVGIPLANLLF